MVGTNDKVNIRKDSTWNVPEPELTLLISSEGTIEGYTIGNDMSSRSIEGEKPIIFYLKQKYMKRCAGLGPCIYLPEGSIDNDTVIHLKIERAEKEVFNGEVGINQMKRFTYRTSRVFYIENVIFLTEVF